VSSDRSRLDELSGAMGLGFLGPGNHNGCSVSHAWSLTVSPSFDPWFAFALAATHPDPADYSKTEIRIGGSTDVHPAPVVRILSDDPVIPALRCIELYHGDERATLDGIRYEFVFSSNEIDARLWMSSPKGASIVRLLDALYAAAGKLVELSGDDELRRCLEVWRDYQWPSSPKRSDSIRKSPRT
jgi:hypothetical protein